MCTINNKTFEIDKDYSYKEKKMEKSENIHMLDINIDKNDTCCNEETPEQSKDEQNISNHQNSIKDDSIEIKEEVMKTENNLDIKDNSENHLSEYQISENVEINAKIDSKDVKESLSEYSNGDKAFKRYQLRKRQSMSYAINDEPPSKKKSIKINDDTPHDITCSICYLSFETKKGLLVHMSHHDQPDKFTCAQCAMEFLTNIELRNHKKVHDEEDCIFTCGRCEVAYSNIMEYLLHKVEHKNAQKYQCEECGKSFEKQHLYKTHLPTHFNVTYKCDVCEKVIRNRMNYYVHLKSHDVTKILYPCGECGKNCKSKKHYDYHMTTHTGVKLYQCLYCGKGFSNTCQRTVHTRIHTDERPYECNICKKTFKQFTDHQRHMSNHNAEKFKCTFCGKEYKQKPYLAFHMRIHTRQNLMSCPVCNKKFTIQASLKSHFIYCHTEEKPYKCDICNVAFKRPCHFQRHLKLRKHKNNTFGVELKMQKLKEIGTN